MPVRLEELQVFVVKESRRTTVDLEPVGTNEILLVKDRVGWTHELEIPHLSSKNTRKMGKIRNTNSKES